MARAVPNTNCSPSPGGQRGPLSQAQPPSRQRPASALTVCFKLRRVKSAAGPRRNRPLVKPFQTSPCTPASASCSPAAGLGGSRHRDFTQTNNTNHKPNFSSPPPETRRDTRAEGSATVNVLYGFAEMQSTQEEIHLLQGYNLMSSGKCVQLYNHHHNHELQKTLPST